MAAFNCAEKEEISREENSKLHTHAHTCIQHFSPVVLEIEPRASYTLDKHPTPELLSHISLVIFFKFFTMITIIYKPQKAEFTVYS
jgi:hypothetical protein